MWICDLTGSNPQHASPYVTNLLNNVKPSSEKPAVTPAAPPGEPEVTRLRYDDVRHALQTGVLPGKPPPVLTDITAEQATALASDLDPAHDHLSRWVASEPRLGFTEAGFTVQGTRSESIPQHKDVREKLRPALVAANRFGLRIPWHRDLLLGARSHDSWNRTNTNSGYVSALLASLGAQEDASRLYEELEEHGDVLLPRFDDVQRLYPALQGSRRPLTIWPGASR